MNHEERVSMGRAWLVVALVWPVALLNYLDRLTITTMHDSLMASIAMSEAQFGLLTSVFLWVYAVVSPLGGFVADRFGRTRAIIGSLLLWSLFTALTGFCASVNQLLAVRALMGISEACYIPAALALIMDYHPPQTRSLAAGIHASGIYAGTALGGVGGLLASWYSWQTAFQLFGLCGIAYACVLMLVLRDRPVRAKTDAGKGAEVRLPDALKSLLTRPSFLVLLCYSGLLSMAYWGIYGWLPTYLKEHFAMGQGAAGLSATGYIQAASCVGIVVGGIWADRWSRTQIRGRIFVPALGFMVAGPALAWATSTDVLAVTIGCLLVFGVARGFADANQMPILCQVAEPEHRATGYGFMNFGSCFVGGIMIYAGGALKDHQVGLDITFKCAAVGLFFAGVILLFIVPKREPGAEGAPASMPDTEPLTNEAG